MDFCRVHKIYPNGNALRSQLNWSQYRMLIQIPDPDKREYYELEAVNEDWTGRQLERQISLQTQWLEKLMQIKATRLDKMFV